MDFISDNTAGVSQVVANQLSAAANGYALAYGTDILDDGLRNRFEALFECELSLYPVISGTAANALCLASVLQPGGVGLCHQGAHIHTDECGAVSHLSGGGRLEPIDGVNGKLLPDGVALAVAKYAGNDVHWGRADALSLTQLTEAGTAYTLDELSVITDIARANNIAVHMDGARFANALVAIGATPAEMTWQAGIDILSFGGTKNGCWSAEAIVCFNPRLDEYLGFLRKRSGHLVSKSRFICAQFEAYLDDEHWLALAKQANAMGARLRQGIASSRQASLAWPGDANQVFVRMEKKAAQRLLSSGAQFRPQPLPHYLQTPLDKTEDVYRLVASFSTTKDDVDRLIDLIG